MITQTKRKLQLGSHSIRRSRKPALLVDFEERGIPPDRSLHARFLFPRRRGFSHDGDFFHELVR